MQWSSLWVVITFWLRAIERKGKIMQVVITAQDKNKASQLQFIVKASSLNHGLTKGGRIVDQHFPDFWLECMHAKHLGAFCVGSFGEFMADFVEPMIGTKGTLYRRDIQTGKIEPITV